MIGRLSAVYAGVRRGFTLIELLLVVVILGVVAGLALPQFGPAYNSMVLSGTAQGMADLMRYAQARSARERAVYRFVLSDERRRYRIERAVLDEKGAWGRFEAVRSRMGRTFYVPRGVEVQADSESARFYPDGTIEKDQVVLTSGGKSLVVSTREERGHVTVHKKDDT